MKGVKINISRHHYCETAANRIFRSTNPLEYIIPENASMQCVLMKDYIGSVAEIKKYIDFFSLLGVNGFSFRGLSALDPTKKYYSEVNFTSDQSVDFFAIANQIADDPDFQFVQQKIGDHYVYEIYTYKGKHVRFTYSNFDFLRKIETQERNNNQWYSRAIVISPQGHVYAGWTYDINMIA